MRVVRTDIDARELREKFNYDQLTGKFTHKDGRSAGYVHLGYEKVVINRFAYMSHRLAWLFVYGEWPVDQIDHINLDRRDNRIANLRQASSAQNNRNKRPRASSGFKGVSRETGYADSWRARICRDGKEHFLGRFASRKEAHAAYSKAAAEMHGEFARVS